MYVFNVTELYYTVGVPAAGEPARSANGSGEAGGRACARGATRPQHSWRRGWPPLDRPYQCEQAECVLFFGEKSVAGPDPGSGIGKKS